MNADLDATLQRIMQAALAPLHREICELRAMLAPPPGDEMDSAELGKLLKKSPAALRMFLKRHPDFPRKRIGRRYLFSRIAVQQWLAAHGGSDAT